MSKFEKSSVAIDDELNNKIEAWPKLPVPIRRAIMAPILT